LIRRAELIDGRLADVHLRSGRIATIGDLAPQAGERVLEAAGGLLLPGLHDHHIHVAATAAALSSVRCGPPDVADAEALARLLARPGQGWLRGVGYHESVAGLIDRDWLDDVRPDRPVRIQHRSGRLWVFNSLALQTLLAAGIAPPAGLEREGGRWTGRLYDEDAWLREAMGSVPPDFAAVGAALARCGVTGLTDMSPANDPAMADHFAAEHARGALPQSVLLAGRDGLESAAFAPDLALGPLKIHLHEAHLPDYDATVDAIRRAHHADRPAAVHCVTEVELVFTLAALREAGVMVGDRIEHASVTPQTALDEIAELGLAVAVQPNFVRERGDAYRAAIPQEEWPNLYRLRSLAARGVPLAGGGDAPFGGFDPWVAMAAAVERRTAAGEPLGEAEALTPEAALALFLCDPQYISRQRRVEEGAPAHLCLLTAPWRTAREQLTADFVRATFIDGRIVHDRVHQPQP
jgi:predicted amidohydrolase YtcJ